VRRGGAIAVSVGRALADPAPDAARTIGEDRVDAFETFLEVYGLVAVFAVMLSKAIGIPVPIPADVIILAMGARAADGKVLLWQVFLALLVAMTLGGAVQFLLARGVGRRAIYRVGRYIGLTQARLDAAARAVRRGGILGIGLAILTPGVRTATVPACGLAGLSLAAFIPGLILGSTLNLAFHLGLGFLGAPLLAAMLGAVPLPALLALVLLGLGLAVWLLLVRRRRGSVLEAVAAWEDATCPVCIALGARGRLAAP
jgi:membrane protein DedA with SNARE-associated domain